MASVREFFAREAGDYLDRLDRLVEGMDGGSASPAELHRVARALRGSAQMAREDGIAQVASALEGVARALAEGQVRWTPDLGGRVRDTVRDVRQLLGGEPDDATVKNAVARVAGVAAALGRGGVAAARNAASAEADRQFREFAARETAGVLVSVENALQAIGANAMDREPLKVVLRRQRALMGAARLPSIPLLAEVLTAIDEITRMVARLDVAVQDEWLEGYRTARDVLASLSGALQRGAEPAPSSALARLRTIRQELTDRHGGGEEPMRQPPLLTPEDAANAAGGAPAAAPAAAQAAPSTARLGNGAPARSAAPGPAAVAPAAARAPAATASGGADGAGEVHSIDQFLYRGERALGRAIELRPELERAVGAGESRARELLAELYDLIELARASAGATT